MRLSSLLSPKLICCPLASADKEPALREMDKRLCAAAQQDIEADVMTAVSAREKFGGFTMGHGVAFPHARTDRVRPYLEVSVGPTLRHYGTIVADGGIFSG